MNEPVAELQKRGRFVILRHEVGDFVDPTNARGDHFDWMFESAGVLKVWATSTGSFSGSDWTPGQRPFGDGFRQVAALQLPDHRVAYLEYEGEVSRGRGRVSRIEAGDYELLSAEERDIELHLRFDEDDAATDHAGETWRRLRLECQEGGLTSIDDKSQQGPSRDSQTRDQRIRDRRPSCGKTIAWRLDFSSGRYDTKR